MINKTLSLGLRLRSLGVVAVAGLSIFGLQANAQSLGSAESFGVLAYSTVTNTGSSIINGSVGVSPGSAITGFPPGVVVNGALHANDGVASQAYADFATAYNAYVGLVSPPANDLTGSDLGGMTLTPGIYHFDTEAASGGILTLDAQNDPNARFVIKIGTTLITSSSSSVVLINQADARKVFFQVGSSATLGSGSSFIGNILAYASITAVGGTNVTGRLFALTGAVTMDSNGVSSPGLTPSQLLNISTRLKVQTGESVSIAGFIITGNVPKKVIVRGIGPSLDGVNSLADPVLELHGPTGALIATNDNWKDSQQTEIQNTTIAPTNDLESAIVATLAPGGYTAVLAGQNGTNGVGLVEMFDLAVDTDSQLANISSRGFVQGGGDVMIGGFILGNGTANKKVLIRAIGPSLSGSGITNVLADPTLELHDANGAMMITDDNWKDDAAQAVEITATGLPPQNDLESAIVTTVTPAPYTAIVAGKNGGTGVALAEVYPLQ
jgi:hypothetical protein